MYDIKAANRLISIAALLYGIPFSFGACNCVIDADVMCLSVDFINQQLVDAIHAHGMLVYVYTVNDSEDLVRVINYGVDGIITDYP